MHKLRITDIDSLMPAQWQCLRYKKLLIEEHLIDKNIISGILEVFLKIFNIIAAGWDPKLCRWLRWHCLSKSWWWLEKRWDFKHSLIKQQELMVSKAVKVVKAVKAEQESIPSRRWLTHFFLAFKFFLLKNSNAKLAIMKLGNFDIYTSWFKLFVFLLRFVG